jgi:16S rRNA (guanine527-N7)-methyltransferase
MKDFSSQYLHILKTELSGLNLTKILDPDEFYNKQILDSINPYIESKLFQNEIHSKGIVVDVGFGGGFPILPLARMLPHIKFIGIESKNKKVEAVRLIAHRLGLSNVKLIHSRLEDVIFDIPAVVTFKAVGTAEDYLPAINHDDIKLTVFLYKGPSFMELEGGSLKKLEKKWKMLESQEINVPGTEKRYLISFASSIVPRGTNYQNKPSKITKNLVKLSDFI